MERINTVTGSVSAADLGSVLTHEHVFVVQEDFRLNFLRDWDEEAQIANAVEVLTRVKQSGVDTLMDVSVVGLGRNVERIARVAEKVDLNIVVATGLYTYNDLPFQFHYTGPGLGFDVAEPLDDMLIRDITTGIGATSIKAGFLMCVIESEGLTAGVERVMRSVGRAAVATGAPVVVHTNPHTKSGLVAQRVLAEEGVDLSRVVLAHSGDSTDLDHLMRLADAGSILGMDRFGVDVLLPYADRLDTLTALLERGYADRLVLSQDAFCFSDWFDQEAMRAVTPDWNYFQITGRVVPDLRRRGVSEDAIAMMLAGVPKRLLTRPNDLKSAKTGLSPKNGA